MGNEELINIALLDGTDFGPKRITIQNWALIAFYSPRANIINILKSKDDKYFDFTKPGVYILKSNPSEDRYSEKIYIGQTDVISRRIGQHLQNPDKDFTELIVFCGNGLHIPYIESVLITEAKDCKNAEIELENGIIPKLPNIDIVYKATMNSFIEKIKLILPLAGFNFLKPNKVVSVTQDGEADKYYLSGNGVSATLVESFEGFIVLKGSGAVKDARPGLGASMSRARDKCIDDKNLTKEGDKYIFQENTIFNSLSTAAAVVLGSRVSGPKFWKDKDGKTYDEANSIE